MFHKGLFVNRMNRSVGKIAWVTIAALETRCLNHADSRFIRLMPRTESRWRALLWPSIRNDGDFDYITAQGFWICFIVAALTLSISAFNGSLVLGAFEAAFLFLAGVGIRQRGRVAAIAAFCSYFLSALVLQRYTGNGCGIIRVIFLLLLFANIRGNWLRHVGR